MEGPILILGIQGAGKSTLGRLVAESTGATHLSAGTLLRRRESAGGPWAREIASRLSRGEGVGTEISYGLLAESIGEPPRRSPLVLDGYPRIASQISLLRDTLGCDPELAFLLNVPRPIAIHRILGREVCGSCDAAYGPGLPPRITGVCDSCKGALSPRKDDLPSAVSTRLDGWSNYSRGIIDHYKAEGTLREIDGSRPADEVLVSVLAEIGNSATTAKH
jgi:adenylate kinase